MSLGKIIKKFRELRRITQKALGDRTHLDDVRIRQYELDIRTPKDDVLENISAALHVNKDYLIGGTTTYATRTVSVATGYLALRSAKAYDSSNEIGQLYSGDTVQLVDTTDAQYWYVYSQKLCKYGYVNKDYLY